MTKRIIAYISLFAFLMNISACTTTETFSDTPEKIFSGKSEIDLKGDYTLDSISLRNKRTIPLKGYMANYIERQKEKYLIYYYPKGTQIDSALMKETDSKIPLYKKPVADTLNFNAIDSMYFSGKKTDVSYAVLGIVIGAPVALFFLFWSWGVSMKHK
ncbi:MAG: hypothetical protein ACOYN6_03840 [Ignavibacteria bacterium]